MSLRINPDRCTLCGICQDVCPGDILHLELGMAEAFLYPDECSYCDICRMECPEQAIDIRFPWKMLQPPVVLTPSRRPSHA
jgi:adenylylsulfate reductase subunit B